MKSIFLRFSEMSHNHVLPPESDISRSESGSSQGSDDDENDSDSAGSTASSQGINASDFEIDDTPFADLTRNDNFAYLSYNNSGRGVLLTDKAERRDSGEERRDSGEEHRKRKPSHHEKRVNETSRPSRHRSRESQRSSGRDKVAGIQIKQFPEGLNPSARRNEWILWREQLMLFLSLKKTLKTQAEKRAFLVVSGGREIQRALSDKPVPGEITEKSPVPVFDNALLRLDNHFQTGTNAITDIIRFRKLTQKSGEQFIDFVHRLQENAAHCGFGDAEENEILIQIRTNATHALQLGQMMTRENKTLADVINFGSSLDNEESLSEGAARGKKESDTTENNDFDAAYVQKASSQNRFKGNRQRPYQEDTRRYNQEKSRPPQRGQDNRPNRQVCYNCKKPGHFIRDCRSRPRYQQISYASEDVKQNVRNEWLE